MSKTTIPTGGITADAITDAKIADGVVGTEHLTDAEVTFGKLSTSGTEGDNVKQRVCKVWINLNGASSGAPARDDFNVSSTTDEGTGDYTISYSTDLGNDDYAILTGSGRTESGSGGHNRLHEVCVDRYAAGSHRLLCVDSDDDSAKDMHGVFSAVFGDS
jgi:hypothetical protein